jgi:hypothetical protein
VYCSGERERRCGRPLRDGGRGPRLARQAQHRLGCWEAGGPWPRRRAFTNWSAATSSSPRRPSTAVGRCSATGWNAIHDLRGVPSGGPRRRRCRGMSHLGVLKALEQNGIAWT